MGATGSVIKLSIVVPCYKTEAYLAKCLDSLLAQTLGDIEVICVNDGSPDGCLGLMRDYERQHPGLVRVVDRENGGLWNARWSGIDVARGEYIGFVDSDDFVEPRFAEALYEAAKTADADISVCGFQRVDLETGRVLSHELCEAQAPFRMADDPGKLISVNPAVWNKAYRASVLHAMHRLAEPPAILEDLTFDLLAYLESPGTVAFAPEPLVNYVVHADSMINTVTSAQVEGVKRSLLEIRGYYEADGADEDLLAAFDALAFLHLGVSMSFRLSCTPGVRLAPAIRETTAYLDAHFPTWRRSPYINLAFARANGGAALKLLIAQRFYKAHLMTPFLAAYRFVLERLHVDIKW